MALDLTEDLRVLFASAIPRLRSIVVLQITHSALTRPYYLWRESTGATIRLESGAVVTPEPANFTESIAGSPTNLDQQFQFNLSTLGQAGETFRTELARIPLLSEELLLIAYLEYRSDQLEVGPGASQLLQVESISYGTGSATFSAVAPRLKATRTGDLYSLRQFPMLRDL